MSASMALAFLPEVVAVAMVALVSLVTKTSALELARKTSGDLDAELRAHGVVTLSVAPLGGIGASMQLGSSRLLDHAGAATGWSGAAAAFVLLFVGLVGFDLPALIPLPIAAGLVFYLGYSFLLEALAKPLAQRAWVNLVLALAIAAACVRYGYLAGVVGGIVAACLLFALSYARTGVVRQHLSRAQFAGNVSRSAAASRYLGEVGESIQLYWLTGYVFFGSSEGVFERVRDDLRARPPRQVGHVVLDLGMVSGADASASISLAKLRNHCRQLGVVLLFSSIPRDIAGELEREGLFGGKDQPPPFADVNEALAWCEERTLAQTGLLDADAGDFEDWLEQQLGSGVRAADFMAYLDRREIEGSQVLYREGEPSDDIDLVAAGRLVVEIGAGTGHALRVRSITTHTVVGEMGFVRRAARSATVSSEGDATVFVLTRAHFERMRRERPDLAIAFFEFLMRTVADRIGLSERMALALGR
jgi:SulP family sulfate permease